MQLQGLMFMLFMLVIIPILILTTSHNIFFVVVGVVLFVISMRNIYVVMFPSEPVPPESDDDMVEELEEAMNLDMKKFGTGAKVARNLLFILFFIYCGFYVNALWLKIMALTNILYWVHDGVKHISKNERIIVGRNKSRLKEMLFLLVNTCAVLLITFVVCNKFMGSTL